MTMSIAHRATGIANYVGSVLLVIWLAAAAIGQEPLAVVNAIYGSWFGQLVLFGYTWALIHHMLGGIRHFIWDTGRGFGASEREWLVRFTLLGSIALTITLWGIGYLVVGGLR